MRPVVIVVPAPAVEADLGSVEGQKAASLQEFGLHGAMQSLELAHGLRVPPLFSKMGRLQRGLMPRRISQTESLVSLVEPFC